MRKSLLTQLPLVPVAIDHNHARELAAVSFLLERLPEAVKLVHEGKPLTACLLASDRLKRWQTAGRCKTAPGPRGDHLGA